MTDFAKFAIALALLIVTTLLANAIFQQLSRPTDMIVLFVLAYAEIVSIAEVASQRKLC